MSQGTIRRQKLLLDAENQYHIPYLYSVIGEADRSLILISSCSSTVRGQVES